MFSVIHYQLFRTRLFEFVYPAISSSSLFPRTLNKPRITQKTIISNAKKDISIT